MDKDLGDSIFRLTGEFKDNFARGNLHWINAGDALNQLFKLKPWRQGGHNKEEWIKGELLISLRTCQRLRQVAETWGKYILANPQYSQIDFTKLEICANVVASEREEILQKVANLTVRDTIDLMRERAGKEPRETCNHEGITICKFCRVRM